MGTSKFLITCILGGVRLQSRGSLDESKKGNELGVSGYSSNIASFVCLASGGAKSWHF